MFDAFTLLIPEKTVANYALLRCKTFSLKILVCKIFDKFHVCLSLTSMLSINFFSELLQKGMWGWPIWGPRIDASENVFTPGRDSQRRGSAKSSILLVSESMCGRFSLGFDKSFEGAFEWCRFFFVLCQTTFTLSISDRFHYIAQNMTSKTQPSCLDEKKGVATWQSDGGWLGGTS